MLLCYTHIITVTILYGDTDYKFYPSQYNSTDHKPSLES